MVLGSVVSVFFKDSIHNIFRSMGEKKLGIAGIVAASALGVASLSVCTEQFLLPPLFPKAG